MPSMHTIGKVSLGITVGGATAALTEKLWGGPLRNEAGKPQPDNGLAHVGAAFLAIAPAAGLLKVKAPQRAFVREAVIGASIGSGLAMLTAGSIEAFRGANNIDPKFAVPWLLTD